MRARLLGLGALAGAVALALALTGASDDSAPTTYRIEFDNAFGLVEGGDFRVGGVRAGQTTGLEVIKRPGEAPKAVVTAEITEPGFADFRADASCEIRPQSLIGEYYADCQPGSSPEKLATDGSGTVPVAQTASTIPPDLVNNVMRRPYRERLRLIVTELGTGLAGRPDDLQQVLRRAHPGLRETTRVLRILANQNRVIKRFLGDADTVVRELAAKRGEVARFVEEAGRAADVSASRRDAIRQSFNRLPALMDELEPTMARLGQLADEQVPLLADLRVAAPDLDRFLDRLAPFARAARPALVSLGEVGETGLAAFRAGDEEVAELRALSADAPGFAEPLRQYLTSMDDRKRALEDDPRAKAAAPPPPDPTAIEGTGGFTGLEGIWNYFFWQTLSINGVDDAGHILRISLTANECSNFRNQPPQNAEEERLFERCNQYMGPSQPGVTTPDFTSGKPGDPGYRDDEADPGRRSSSAPAPPPGEPGGLEQPPLPGQRDLSKPQIVLPPAVQELLERLRGGLEERTPLPQPEAGADQILDFLLAP